MVAYNILRYRVLRRIGEVYPYLQNDCMELMREIPLKYICKELPDARYRLMGAYRNTWL